MVGLVVFYLENEAKFWYNIPIMYNWSTDTDTLKKYPEKFTIWKLEQLINFGLGNQKLHKNTLKKYLEKLDIETSKKRYLKFLLS